MLTLIQAPDAFTPSVLGRPVQYVVRHPELIVQSARRSRYVFTITGTGQNGQTFRVRGQEYTTDDSSRYTDRTFDHSSLLFLSTFNLAGMLRRSPAFRNYFVRSVRPSAADSSYRVIAEAAAVSDDEDYAADNDLDGLSNVALVYEPGRTEQRADEQLYYQVFTGTGPIGPERYAPFDEDSQATIDIRSEARSQVSFSPPPDPAIAVPVWDESALEQFTIRYGTYVRNPGGGEPVYGQVRETGGVPVVASLLQPWETDVFKPFGPNRNNINAYSSGGAKLPWLTVRSDRRRIARNSNAWTAIYLGENPFYGSSLPRRVSYRMLRKVTFNGNLTYLVLDESVQEIEGTGILVVPTGHNAVPESLSGSVDRLEIAVEHDIGIFSWAQESDQLTIDFHDNEGCQPAELYLLEGLGSWATIPVDEVLARSLASDRQTVNQPLIFSTNQGPVDSGFPFSEGGVSQFNQSASERIQVQLAYTRSSQAKLLESVASSPYGILRWTDETTQRERYTKVLFSPEELRLHVSDNPSRPLLSLLTTHETFQR